MKTGKIKRANQYDKTTKLPVYVIILVLFIVYCVLFVCIILYVQLFILFGLMTTKLKLQGFRCAFMCTAVDDEV